MTWLAAALAALVTKILEFFGTKLAKKLLLAGTAVGMLVALAAAMALAINGFFIALAQSHPGGWIAFGIGLLPGNTSACVSAVAWSYASAWLYRQQTWATRLTVQAS